MIKHGFGEWETVLKDPSLPFYEILKAKLKEKNMALPKEKIEKKEDAEKKEDDDDDDDDAELPEEDEEEGSTKGEIS